MRFFSSLSFFRLVMVDVAFYSENVQALRSLECLDLNMPEIWEQKRWWRTARPGQSGLLVTPTISVTSSAPESEEEVRSVGEQTQDSRSCLFFNTSVTLESSSSTSRSRRRLLPQWGCTFQGLEGHLWCRNVDTNRMCPGGTDMLFFLWRPNQDKLVWLTNRSWELWGICVLFVLSASFSTITTGQLSICVQFCPVIIFIIIAELFNGCQMNQWIVIYLNWFCCWLINHVFFPSKAFRWRRIGELVLKRVLKHILLTCSLFSHQHKCDFTGFHVQAHWLEVLKLWRVKDQGFLSTFIRTICLNEGVCALYGLLLFR